MAVQHRDRRKNRVRSKPVHRCLSLWVFMSPLFIGTRNADIMHDGPSKETRRTDADRTHDDLLMNLNEPASNAQAHRTSSFSVYLGRHRGINRYPRSFL